MVISSKGTDVKDKSMISSGLFCALIKLSSRFSLNIY